MSIANHPFTRHPHRTLLALSLPVLLSMTAEPLTALVDTAFIASLESSVSLAALGVGATALSSMFWIFNFIPIGAQTNVAQALGRGQLKQARGIASLALAMAAAVGLLLIAVLIPGASWLSRLLGASGEVQTLAVSYMQIRLYGAPAVLLMAVTFGVMRGLQDMRTPLWIALGVNALNVLLDWMLIFGNGPAPEMGVAGSALASTISQWLGALVGVALVHHQMKLSRAFALRDVTKLLRVGGDLFVRTGLLTLYLALLTRVATRIGPDAGAANQAMRQVYSFTALALDAFATTVQSLVGYFYGGGSLAWTKRVIRVALGWTLGTSVVLGAGMWLGRGFVIDLLIPASAVSVFLPAWAALALSQPLNSLAFLTDGVHWGTGDFRFLRNAMIVATVVGWVSVWLLGPDGLVGPAGPTALMWVWIATAVWMLARSASGVLRIYPGIGDSPFGGQGQGAGDRGQ